MLTVTGTVMGKANLYVKLHEASAHILGRRTIDQKVLNWKLVKAGHQAGDNVALIVDTSGPRLEVKEVKEIDEVGLTGAEVDPSEYTSQFTPPDWLLPNIPERDAKYLIPGDIAQMIDAIKKMTIVDNRINIRLTGPQGTGKTSMARAIAANLGWNFVKVDVGSIGDKEDWLCTMTAEDGKQGTITVVHPSAFVYGMTTPRTVVLLDEFNRVDTKLHNAIYGILDEQGWVASDYLKTRIDRAPDVIVIATMNVEETNVGVSELDSAIKDRFPYEIRLELLPEGPLTRVIVDRSGCDEEAAALLARLAHEVEKLVGSTLMHGTGTRSLIAAGKLIRQGVKWIPACSYTVAAGFSHYGGAGSARATVTNLIMGLNPHTF